nr:hypothetical protein [Tanacetum cinerariifolium]
MAPLTFVDTHNMVVFLSKSDASAGFDQIVDFLNAHAIQYALVLRALIDGKKVVVTEDVFRQDLHLDDADGLECFPNEDIFIELALLRGLRGMSSVVSWHLLSSALLQVENLTSLRVETPLFASMLVQPQPQATKEEEEIKVPTAPTPPSPTKQDKHTQALEILKLKKRVKKLEKKKKSRSLGFKRLRKVGTSHRVESSIDTVVGAQVDASKQGKIEAIDADEDITLVDIKTQVDLNKLIEMKAKKAKLLDEQIAKRLHDEEIEKAAARDMQEKDDLERAQVLQKQYDNKEKNIDWNVVAEQIQEKHLDNIRKYQSLKKKPVSIAQVRKNMIIYLQNMAGYKMEHFKGITYDKVRTIFEREYKKVQTLFKPNKDVEEPKKKRIAKETLLQESFKKLKAVEVLGFDSTQETPSNDHKEMSKEDENHSEGSRTYWKIIRVGGITKGYQSFEDMLKGFDKEDLVSLWSLVKEKFSSAVPNVDKEKALQVKPKRLFEPDADDVLWKLQMYMHYLITWKLYTNYGVHQVSSTTRKHDMFMLTEKDYPLSNRVMTLMLSVKLQVEEDSEMARDLVMKIFMEANKPKSRSFDTSSK